MNTLLVPTLAYDLAMLDRMAKSVDYPLKNKVLINNGFKDWIGEWATDHPDWQVINLPENIGVAASWNLAPKLFPFEESWLISNDDQVFQPGALERICFEADNHLRAPAIYVNEFDAYDMFVWTRAGMEVFGYFDENFYPAYFEDYEYRYRLRAGGGQPHRITTDHTFPVRHGRLQQAGPNYMAMLSKCKPINEGYLWDKWANGDHATPFNNYEFHVSYWDMDYKRRALLKGYWDEFWNKSPSVYE